MFNLYWGIFFVLANFAMFLVSYRLFGRTGLYAWIAFATVLANIQVVKTIEMVGVIMTLGNTIYASIYLATDLLNEKYGAKSAKRGVWLGFFCLLSATVMMQMVLIFSPSAEDFAQSSLKTIFGLLPRIAAGSLLAYLVSQLLDVKLFTLLMQRFPHYNQLWIRMNGSTGVSQFIDTLIFCTVAFAGVYSFEVWLQILVTTYVFKWIISVSSTPVLYIARRLKPVEDDKLSD